MKNEFVNYNQALSLKELGFDEDCLMYIDDEEDLINDDTAEWIGAVKAPLKQQVFRWFREKHHMFSHIMTYEGNEIPRFKGEFAYFAEIDFLIASEEIEKPFKTYEEAESACIDKLIEIVKKNEIRN